MRVLIAHTFYRSASPSGEDVAYRGERALLERHGHEVIPVEIFNDDIGESTLEHLRVATRAVWSRPAGRRFAELLHLTKPDVAHFHNTFPQLSPSVYRACQDAHVPVVQTLHNYRLICPGALLLRDGAPCEKCVGRFPLDALVHACYRDSRLATASVAAMLAYNRRRGSYTRDVDRYIALTEFARERFIQGGLPGARLVTRPNFLTDEPGRGNGIGGYAVYVGRLAVDKGVSTLLRAWQQIAMPLRIVGDGPLRAELEQLARERQVRAEFLGLQSRAQVFELVRNAILQVIPSEAYEGFPMAVLEALAAGTPLVTSAIGALDSIVDARSGEKFRAGDADALANAVKRLLSDPSRLAWVRDFNRQHFETNYSEARAIQSLLSVYHEALAHHSNACGCRHAPQSLHRELLSDVS